MDNRQPLHYPVSTQASSQGDTRSMAPTISVPSVPPQSEFKLNLPEVGGLTGAVLAAIIIFGYAISKFKKDTTVNSSEASLYKNLSDRIEVISNTLIRVENERETLLKAVAKYEVRITELEKHEEENKSLRIRLEEKDSIIKHLQQSSDTKQAEIADLQNRIHDLEIQMQQRVIDCVQCEHKRIASSPTDGLHHLIEDET